MPSLPTRLSDIRALLQATDWDQLSLEVDREAHARLAIVGPVNSGKSTLFNRLRGRNISPVKAIPGTTTDLVTEEMGPFVLVDTPGFGEVGGVDRAVLAQKAARSADLVVLVLDASAGLRQADYDLYESLRDSSIPPIVALNKTDLIKHDLDEALADVEQKLKTTVIPISAKTGAGVGDRLMPAIVEAHPWMTVALGRALPAFRHQLCQRLIRSTALLNAVIAAEPIPGVDIPLLLASQVRLVLRIAAIYGESLTVRHARELLTTIAGGVALRYLAAELGKALPGPGWLIGATITGLGTEAIGQVAMAYFEGGRKLSPAQLRQKYKEIIRNARKRKHHNSTVTQP